MARISTIRLLIAMTSIHNLIIYQMHVKRAFLNGDLEEEIYTNQPQGFIMPGNENKICKLIKSLYGLKQAPKQWHQKFDEVVLSNGYLLNQADKCVYSKFDKTGKGVIICLYVDDMLIFGTNQVQVVLAKEFLSLKFSMNDMGETDVILGIRIKHKSNRITIFQSHYIEKVLKKFNYFDYTPVCTPMDTSEKLMPNNGQAVSQLEYSRVLKYLKKTMDYSLTYTGYPLVLEGYTDASWISNTEDNSSTSGWVFLLGGGAISWASKKQTCITGSTMESEFVALATAGKEGEWLKNLLFEISLWSKPIAPIFIRCDSATTLAKAYSQMYNEKSRHLGVRHSMIRENSSNSLGCFCDHGLLHDIWSLSFVFVLIKPAEKFPGLVSPNSLFGRFPYLLPFICISIFALFVTIGAFWLLVRSDLQYSILFDGISTKIQTKDKIRDNRFLETLHFHKKDELESASNVPDVEEKTSEGKESNLISLLKNWPLMSSIIVYCIFSLHDMAYTEIFSLWAVSPTSLGGLNYSTENVGTILSITGENVVSIPILTTSSYLYISLLSGFILSFTLNCASVVKNVLSVSIITSTFILQNKAVDQRQRGAANGIAMTLQSICKAIGPACGGAFFSLCQKRLNAAILPVILEFGNFYPSFTSIEGVKIHFAKHYCYIAVDTPLYKK
ncbi:zinc finger, CCHC-type containing protein [Tanacetum coccineum]